MVLFELRNSMKYFEIKVEWIGSQREITLVAQNDILFKTELDKACAYTKPYFDDHMRVESV
jgi:hypothetical protein